jgi:hypothetical protein
MIIGIVIIAAAFIDDLREKIECSTNTIMTLQFSKIIRRERHEKSYINYCTCDVTLCLQC